MDGWRGRNRGTAYAAGFPVISQFRVPFADFRVVIVLFVATYGAANRVLEPNCC